MRIFITGANGFIGSYLVAALLSEGHEVVAGVRSAKTFARRFPSVRAVSIDLRADTNAADWHQRLSGIDAIINCAGLLHGRDTRAVHVDGPKAMFAGAVLAGVKKIVQISAISATTDAGTLYALSKNEADEYTKTLEIDWTILRPSVVYASGAYGGTALMRGLAALPLAVPLVGKGDQQFQPIHVDDVARTVVQALGDPQLSRRVLEPVGPQTLTLKSILMSLRNWLGLPDVPTLPIPMPIINFAALLGGLVGSGPINSTSVRQLTHGNIGDPEKFSAAVGWSPSSFTDALERHPAQTQDLWHARLYFLAPLLKFALALLWFASGAVGFISGADAGAVLFESIGIPPAWSPPAAIATSALDLVIGAVILSGRWIGAVCLLQLLVVAGYTVFLSIADAHLWLDPLGPLLKNIPIMVPVLVYAAIGKAR